MIRSSQELAIPDTKLSRAVTEFACATESDLPFNHSSRVYCFAALAGQDRGLTFDADLRDCALAIG